MEPVNLEKTLYLPPDCVPSMLRTVGWHRYVRAQAQFLGPHTHGDAYEATYTVAGQIDWWVDDKVYEVRRDQVFLTRPGEIHVAVDDIIKPCEFYWIQFSLAEVGRQLGLAPDEAAAIQSGMASLRHRVFAASSEMLPLFRALLEAQGTPGPIGRVLAAGVLKQLLARIILDDKRYDGVETFGPGAVTREIRLAAEYLRAHFRDGEGDFIDGAARVAGLRRRQFHQRFLSEIGLGPGEYRNRLRMQHAKELLRRGQSVTRTAMDLGFSTGQYFSTAFKSEIGMTPRQYRAKFKPGAGRREV